jgi:NAD-specific glutamate dehydrogenase
LGSRPYAVICDESKEISEEIINIARAWIDTERAMFFSLTTVDYETNKNWSYTNAIEAEFRQLEYAPIEDDIVDIRDMYELDKKDKQWFLDNPDTLEEIRREFLKRRPLVALRYNIYDSKFKVQLNG